MNKESLLLVALGQVENPSIEIMVDGESHKFKGRDAKVFAFGVLAGMKAAQLGAKIEPALTSNL